MQVVTGKIIQKGIAIGPLRVFHEEKTAATIRSGRTPAEEWGRFEAACERAKEQLVALYDWALEKVGQENAAICEIHQMMLEDEDYLDAIRNTLQAEGSTAEYAVTSAGEHFAGIFAAM